MTAEISEAAPDWPCCQHAVYDDRIGWWCPEHGDPDGPAWGEAIDARKGATS